MYTEEVNKIVLSSDDDKRLQTFDGIETYPYVTTNEILRVFASKMFLKYKLLILMIMLMKIKLNIIKIGHIFQIIRTKY